MRKAFMNCIKWAPPKWDLAFFVILVMVGLKSKILSPSLVCILYLY